MGLRSKALLALACAALAAATVAPAAQGANHLMKIRAVFLGPADVSFIQLQMTAAGQNLVNGTQVRIHAAAGGTVATYTLDHNVTNAQDQAYILLGDTSTAGSPDFVEPSLYTNLQANQAAGAVCFIGIDCFAWGGAGFTGAASLSSPATPAVAGTLTPGMVNVRTITAGCPTALDELDDTNSSLADFTTSMNYPPRNNAATPSEVPCVTPGTCKGQQATITGTANADTLNGTSGKDVVSALGGNDTVNGLDGKDLICGDDGKDKLNGGNAKDALLGGAGKDSLSGGNGKDSLVGQGGKDTCKGGKAEDTAKKCEVERSI